MIQSRHYIDNEAAGLPENHSIVTTDHAEPGQADFRRRERDPEDIN